MKYLYSLVLGFVLWHFSYLVYSTLYSLTVMFFFPDNETLNLVVKIVLIPFCFWGAFRLVSNEFAKRQAQKANNQSAKNN